MAEPIDDYDAAIGQFRQWARDVDGKQPGDPVKAVAAIIQAVESEQPPLRLALGADAVGAIEAKLKSVKTELDAWRQVSLDTAYKGAVVNAIGG